ncbi:hypothetical protein U91I_02339 [alpha proteobacterium U9-1i]|nr:hypothetical protein U91I_02339 [alpha proteobacterium U9-1i]
MDTRVTAFLNAAAGAAAKGARGAWAVAVRLKRDAAYRKNACAAAAIAASCAFTAFSIDYLITGGPDWNPAAPVMVQEAHAATVERAPRIAAPRLEAIDMIAMAPAAAFEEADALATLTADDLLGGPDDVVFAEADAILEAASAGESLKAERAEYILGDAPRAALKQKPTTEL